MFLSAWKNLAEAKMNAGQTSAVERTLIAYYTFPSIPPPLQKKSRETQQPLESAIRSICLQFAEQDPVYRRQLLGKLKDDEYSLFQSFQSLDKVTCYIFFDELDNLKAPESSDLIDG